MRVACHTGLPCSSSRPYCNPRHRQCQTDRIKIVPHRAAMSSQHNCAGRELCQRSSAPQTTHSKTSAPGNRTSAARADPGGRDGCRLANRCVGGRGEEAVVLPAGGWLADQILWHSSRVARQTRANRFPGAALLAGAPKRCPLGRKRPAVRPTGPRRSGALPWSLAVTHKRL